MQIRQGTKELITLYGTGSHLFYITHYQYPRAVILANASHVLVPDPLNELIVSLKGSKDILDVYYSLQDGPFGPWVWLYSKGDYDFPYLDKLSIVFTIDTSISFIEQKGFDLY